MSTTDRTWECHISKSIAGCILMWVAVAPALVVAVASVALALASVALAVASVALVVAPAVASVALVVSLCAAQVNLEMVEVELVAVALVVVVVPLGFRQAQSLGETQALILRLLAVQAEVVVVVPTVVAPQPCCGPRHWK